MSTPVPAGFYYFSRDRHLHWLTLPKNQFPGYIFTLRSLTFYRAIECDRTPSTTTINLPGCESARVRDRRISYIFLDFCFFACLVAVCPSLQISARNDVVLLSLNRCEYLLNLLILLIRLINIMAYLYLSDQNPSKNVSKVKYNCFSSWWSRRMSVRS